jgi:hypothetical protein
MVLFLSAIPSSVVKTYLKTMTTTLTRGYGNTCCLSSRIIKRYPARSHTHFASLFPCVYRESVCVCLVATCISVSLCMFIVVSLGSDILEDVSAEKARMIQTLDSESPMIALTTGFAAYATLQNTISDMSWECYSQLDDDQKRDFRRPDRRLVALAERMIANAAHADASVVELEKIQQTAHVYETDARATRLLCKSVLEELVTRFDEQLEREKELILWHETTVKSNAKMHGHALYAVQETAKMLKSSRDKLEVVRAECQAASSSLTTEHALVVEQVTG